MSFLTVSRIAADPAIALRVTACAAITDPMILSAVQALNTSPAE